METMLKYHRWVKDWVTVVGNQGCFKIVLGQILRTEVKRTCS